MNAEIQAVPEMRIAGKDVLWHWKATDWAEALLVKDEDGDIRLLWRHPDGRISPSYRLHDWEVELLRQFRKAVETVPVNERPREANQMSLFK